MFSIEATNANSFPINTNSIMIMLIDLKLETENGSMHFYVPNSFGSTCLDKSERIDGRQKVLNMERNGTQNIMTVVVAKPCRTKPAALETSPIQQVKASWKFNRRTTGDRAISDRAPTPNFNPK